MKTMELPQKTREISVEEVLEKHVFGKREYFESLCHRIFYPVSLRIFDDAFQIFAFKVWLKYSTFTRGRSLKKWFATIFVNSCRDVIRRERKGVEKIIDHEIDILRIGCCSNDFLEPEKKEENDLLFLALKKLDPPLHKKFLISFFLDGLSQEEVANLCEVPIGTVKSGKSAAVKKMRELLDPENHT